MSDSTGRMELLVATADQSFGVAVAEAIESTGKPVEAEYVEPAPDRLTGNGTIDGAVIDAGIEEPATAVELLADLQEMPIVVLCDATEHSDAIDEAVQAGATDVFPRTTTTAQYELVVERIERASPGTDGTGIDGNSPGRIDRLTDYEQAYREVFESVGDGLVVHDPETGRIVDVNEQFCEMNGYDREALLGENIGIVTAPGEQFSDENAREMVRTAREEGPQRFEWRNQRRNGETFPVEVHLAVVQLDGVERVLASVRDITERNRREREYEQIFNSVQDAITVHDPDTGEMVDVNDTFCELVGYDRETILELGTTGVSVESEGYDEERAEEIIAEVQREGQKGPYEWLVETRDGERRTTEVVATTGEINGEDRVISINRDVTERRRREQEYEQIFDSVNDAITVFDPETGEITDVNDTYHEMVGYDDLERIRELGIEGLSATAEGYTGERGWELIREVSETGEPETVEWRAETKDGDRLWLEATLAPATIGGQERVLSIQRDVTDRKRRERAIRALQEATERLQTAETPADVARTAVEAASDVLDQPTALCWLREEVTGRLEPAAATGPVGADGLGPGLSPGCYEHGVFVDGTVTEYAPGERSTDNPVDSGVFLPLADHGLVAAGTHAGSATGGTDREVTHADGSVIDAARVLADHVTTALDRVERAQAVRESERRFRLIAERIEEVIYLAEPDFSEIVYVNPAYEDIWGRPIQDLYDDASEFLDAVDERDRDSFESEFESMIEEMQAGDPQDSYEFEFRLRHPGGTVRWVNANGYAVELPGGKRRFVGIVEDVTERKRREQRLEVFNRILRHNLRNQLDVIRSHAEVLSDRSEDSHADRIIAAVDELAAIGARARKTDRIMSMGETTGRISVTDALRETVGEVTPERTDVDVTTELSATTLVTNEEALRTAVESALENAVEHADSAVTIAATETAEGCVVRIDDDGPGIPEEELVPIETGTETNLRHGRGLGLWQLRWSVDKLNGELSFDTTKGTTVRVTVPDQRESGDVA